MTSNNVSVQSSVYLDKSIFHSENIDKITKLHKYYQLDQYKVLVDNNINQKKLSEYLNLIKSKNIYKDVEFQPPFIPSRFVEQELTYERIPYKAKIHDNKIQYYDMEFNNFDNLYGLKSVLILISSQPNCIKNLVQMQLYNKQGVYYMKLFIDGFWQIIIVDDLFPVIAENKKQYLISAYYNKKQYYWPNIILKGLAKVFKGYKQLQQFSYIDFVQFLTGCLFYNYQVKNNVSQLFILIEKAITEGSVVVAQTVNLRDNKYKKQLMRLNLMPNTVYIIRNFYEYSTYKQRNRLLQLQNVQYDLLDNYRGLFMEERIQRIIKVHQNQEQEIYFDEDTFWMEINEFQRFFNQISMLKINPQQYFVSKAIKHNRNGFCILQLEVTQYSKCGFKLFQRQLNNKSNLYYSLCDNRMIVCQHVDCQQFNYIDSVLYNDQICQMELNLTNGIYFVIIMSDYHDDPIEIMFSVLSSYKVSIQCLDYKMNRNIFQYQMIDLVSKFGINNIYNDELVGDQIFYRTFFSFKDGFIIEYIKNKSFTQIYRVTKQFTNKFSQHYEIICEDLNFENQINTNLEFDQEILIVLKLKETFLEKIKREIYYKQVQPQGNEAQQRKNRKLQQIQIQKHISYFYEFGLNVNQL